MTRRDDGSALAYFLARRNAKPWKSPPRKHPKMPKGPWRLAAVAFFSAGALVAWLLFRDSGSGALALRVIFGGLVAFVIGMYIVETLWERRQDRHLNAPHESPIGRRR